MAKNLVISDMPLLKKKAEAEKRLRETAPKPEVTLSDAARERIEANLRYQQGGELSGGVRGGNWLEQNLGASGLSRGDRNAAYYVPGIMSKEEAQAHFTGRGVEGGLTGEQKFVPGAVADTARRPGDEIHRLSVQAALTPIEYSRKAAAKMLRPVLSSLDEAATYNDILKAAAGNQIGASRDPLESENQIRGAVLRGMNAADIEAWNQRVTEAADSAGKNLRSRGPQVPGQTPRTQPGTRVSLRPSYGEVSGRLMDSGLFFEAPPQEPQARPGGPPTGAPSGEGLRLFNDLLSGGGPRFKPKFESGRQRWPREHGADFLGITPQDAVFLRGPDAPAVSPRNPGSKFESIRQRWLREHGSDFAGADPSGDFLAPGRAQPLNLMFR